MSFVHEDPDFDGLVRIAADKRRLSSSLVEKDYWVTHTLWSLLESGSRAELAAEGDQAVAGEDL